MPAQHALLSASSSHRWLNCTAAPKFEQQFPEETTSRYALEGTLAHRFCEELANYNFGIIDKRTFNRRIGKLKKEELYDPEMEQTARFYGEYLWQKSLSFSHKPYVVQEERVDLTDWIPDGFGTCDSVMIGGDTLHITDYKHGKGVPVSAENNPQMRLYALGALKKYRVLFGDAIKTVSMAIVQPRITEDVSSDCLSVEDLLKWGEQIKPIAQKAYSGNGDFCAGSWCKFCKGRAVCRARSENATALEDFKDIPIAGRMTEEDREESAKRQIINGTTSTVLSDAEVGDLLKRGEQLVDWYSDLREYALQAILDGNKIPGYRVVAGRSNRQFTDDNAAIMAIVNHGYDMADLYEKKPKSLAAIEKLLGVADFNAIAGEYVMKPLGKPTLVDEGDKRPDYNDAARDFQNVGKTM